MKKAITPILLGLLVTVAARADTSLTINGSTPFGCLQNAFIWPAPLFVSGTFTLPNVSGTGTVASGIGASTQTYGYPPEIFFYNYSIDLSQLQATTGHCVSLIIHFGRPEGCDTDEVWGSPSEIQSATLAPFGDLTFMFAGGCLSPGQAAVNFTMFSEAAPKTNGYVTVIDEYVDAASGQTNKIGIRVPAIVPDIPPNPPPWLLHHSTKLPYAFFQGTLNNNSNNPAPPFTNGFVNGAYDFTLQLLTAPSNGLAGSQVITQTVNVVNGLFNLPLPFDPCSFGFGTPSWLLPAVRPAGNGAFTPLNPPLPLTPTPQAFYAYTAGTVADLAPGQAVTSLNGLTDAVNLQPGSGILFGTNASTITISAQPGVPSDRNLKTAFAAVKPENILSKLVALPIQGWRYTNELAGVRHLGPMAQDFKAAFGLGQDDKFIAFVDEQGVALAAIQGLNEKVEVRSRKSEVTFQKSEGQIDELKTENAKLQAQVTDLRSQLDALQKAVAGLAAKSAGSLFLNPHPQEAK